MTKSRLSLALVAPLLVAACSLAPKPGQIGNCGCESLASASDRVFFAFDKSNLSADASATLGKQSAWLAKYPYVNVLVAGNADERGTETYNLALAQKRADSARDSLVAQGVSADRVKTVSYGKDCPIATGHDEQSWSQNRNAITSGQGFNPQNCK